MLGLPALDVVLATKAGMIGLAAAVTCAGGVLTDLLNPADHIPASKVAYDDFADLFFHSPEEAIVGFSR